MQLLDEWQKNDGQDANINEKPQENKVDEEDDPDRTLKRTAKKKKKSQNKVNEEPGN